MRRYSIILILLLSVPTFSQSLQDILRVEKNARETLTQYAFKRDVLLQELNSEGRVTGEYVRKSEFVFDDRGQRIEQNIQKRSTLTGIKITDEDLEDFAGAQLLGIDDASRYELTLGDRAISVQPRPETKGRYFTGQVEFHPVSLQITKVRGRTEPSPGEHRFPFFTIERGDVGAPYLFPVLTSADDVLHFPNKDVRVKIRTRYYDYRKFQSSVRLVEIGASSADIKPTGAHWPIHAQVKVYFTEGFDQQERQEILRGMQTWNNVLSEIQFIPAGDAVRPETCLYCVTVLRAQLKKHAGQIHGQTVDDFLKFAWIEIDDDADNLQTLMLHELGHSLGLPDSKEGVMKAKLGRRGPVRPSVKEAEAVKRVLKL